MSTGPDSRSTGSGGHPHHGGRRLRHFLRPDGRRVHVAQSPEDERKLRLQLESTNDDFDVYLHGSPEHLEALREVHGHHERRRDALRVTHGEAYDEFEKVRWELDALSTELHMITQHGIALDANFTKYGYAAHLRTRADHDSSASSTVGDGLSEVHDWEAERNNGSAIKFYRRPVVRQYHHKGLLWRAPQSEEVASFELFVDLLYVGIIAITGDTAADDPSGASLLHFCITFIISWKVWTDFTLMISWFDSDDMVQRLSVLFILACIFGYTTNVVDAGDRTYTQLIAFFLAARIFSGLYFTWLIAVLPTIRPILVWNACIIFICCALWIATIHVKEPNRQALIWIAIVLGKYLAGPLADFPVDLYGGISIVVLIRHSKHVSPRLAAWLEGLFEFVPAVNIEHKTERTNAFVTLVFGYSVVGLLYQNRSSIGVNAFYGKAILGLMQAFAFNWIYFEIDNSNIYMHAIRRKIWSSLLWNLTHLYFIMGFVLGAAALSRLVIAHDCPNADPDTLAEAYTARSAAELHPGLRWFYCVGIGVALFWMAIISITHIHKDVSGARLKKSQRLTFRIAVAIVLICLPTAHRLNSLQLVATVTGLVWLVLLVELYGLSVIGVSLFGRHGRCSYTAECPMRKKDLEEAVRTGERLEIGALAEKGTVEKGLFEFS
ncbi:MAG: hypothetical protein M1826_002624 [Phylliscum demangeonii]|nr:MAG: hypothetical protein M1826_002624 [Phylliscum demangeonii]